jgi:hypothetical protein
MRTGALTGVAVLLVAGSLAAAADTVDVRLVQALRLTPVAAAPPPPLALRRLSDNRTVTLGDLRGRPLLLYFWATW